MNIRFAAPEDAQQLLDIYAQYMETTITFEYVTPTLGEFRQRIVDFGAFYPYLVWEEDGKILGYAYAHRIRERAAYQWDAELSIYLDQTAHSLGRGNYLYRALIDLLKLQGMRNVFGLVTTPNPKSEALHMELGFSRAGVIRNAGYKSGHWCDVIYFEKSIAPYGDNPRPAVSIHEVDPQKARRVLEDYRRGWETRHGAKLSKKQDQIRSMTISDYEEVHALWTQIKGFGIRSIDDSREGVEKFLERSSGCSVVAKRGGKVVGAILCGHDGRRGCLYHVCVHPDWRRQGIGKSMVFFCMEALKKEGINKVSLIAFTKNDIGNAFWKEVGWTRREDLNYYDFTLNAENITAFNK